MNHSLTRRGGAMVLGIVLVAVGAGPAHGDDRATPPEGTVAGISSAVASSEDLAATAALRERMHALLDDGLTIEDVASSLGQVMVLAPSIDPEPTSGSSDISLDTPWVTFDPYTSGGVYVAGSSFRWNNTSWKSDCPAATLIPGYPGTTSRTCGGYDGMGIRVSRAINDYGKSAQFYSSTWDQAKPHPGGSSYDGTKPHVSPHPWESNQHGATFRYQDRRYSGQCSGDPKDITRNWKICHKYLGNSGRIIMTFKLLSNNCHQFYATVLHSWSSTQISGFGVSSGGFSVSWSSSNNRWQRTSSAGKLKCA